MTQRTDIPKKGESEGLNHGFSLRCPPTCQQFLGAVMSKVWEQLPEGGGRVEPGDMGGGWIISVLSQGRRGNSLDRWPQGGPHISGAVGEETRPAMNRKLSDHPPPPPSQYPPAPPLAQQRYLQHHHFHQVSGRDGAGTVRWGAGPSPPTPTPRLRSPCSHCHLLGESLPRGCKQP